MKKIIIYLIASFYILQSGASQTIDSAIIKVTYSFSFRPDSNNSSYIRNDVMILEIGNKFSKFHSYYRYLRDSLINEQLESQHQQGETNIKVDMRGTKSGSSRVIFRNNISNSYTITSNLGLSDYLFIDSVTDMKWLISYDTSTVSGYSCTKAETRFRGRDYIAWFANQIPVSCGPYKFGGLPGLIISLKELKGNFEYKLISLEKNVQKTPIDFEKGKFTKVSRKEFQKLVMFMVNDPDAFLLAQGMQIKTKSIDGNTNPVLPKLKKNTFNPMELE